MSRNAVLFCFAGIGIAFVWMFYAGFFMRGD
jgi:hypothetical protein